jgi:type I restriction enzyme S subunit
MIEEVETRRKMKDSGIPFIGEIPEDWQINRLKLLLNEPMKYGANESAEYDDTSLPRYIRITDFGDDGNLRDDTFKSMPEDIAIEYYLKEGDILFARSGATVGKTFIFKNYKGKACFAGYLIKASTDKGILNPEFLYYFTKSNSYENWKNSIFIQATIQNISAEKYNNLLVPLPSIKEQKLILNYLDRKTSQLDALIKSKQDLIILLEQKRQSTINEAVTGALQKNVKRKSTGLSGLPEVPEHWAVKKLKYVASLQSGNFISAEEINETGQYPVYGGNGLRGYANSFTHEGAFALIGRQGALCGNINYANGKFYATEHAVVVTILDDSDYFWLGELLRNMNLNQYSQASAQPGLSVEKIANLLIPFPPVKEQKEISKVLKGYTEKINSLKENINSQIILLQQYRQSLISEVVTGKVEVERL